MTRRRSIHRCADCGAVSPRWAGRCPTCGEWNTLVEELEETAADSLSRISPGLGGSRTAELPVPLTDVDAATAEPTPTGVPELDRVLGGGLVPGSVTLLAGEPGMGKSTLLLQALGRMARAGARCLLVGAEESPEQVRLRAERVDALHPELCLVADPSLPAILAVVAQHRPDVLAVDSIQTIVDPDRPGAPGSVTQVRE